MRIGAAAALVPAILFVGLAVPFVPYPGLHQDEVLFAVPLYDTSTIKYVVTWFGREIPLMILTYLGCLKTWLYAPIFAIVPASIWTVRLPAVLIAAVTVLLTFRLLDQVHGRRAAWIGGLLLATDAVFVLTSVFDWGPVVIQQALGVAVMTLGLAFYRTRRSSRLFLAGLLAGLALWNKALFLWTLAGLISACAIWGIALWRRHGAIASARDLAAAAFGIALGAAPLIAFGLQSGFGTIASGSGLDASSIVQKRQSLTSTLDGSGLFGYLTVESDDDHLRDPAGVTESAVVWIADALGPQRQSLMPWILGVSLASLPWLSRKTQSAVGFLGVAAAVSWLALAMTRDAGASVHHVVLLWPLPQLIVALAAADLSRRAIATRALVIAGVAAVVCVNLLIVNQYLSQLIRFGSPGPWTGATHALIDWLRERPPGSRVLLSDWGIDHPVRTAFRGALPIDWVGTPEPVRNQDQDNYYRHLLEAPGVVWVTHTDSEEITSGTNAAVEELARQLGFSVHLLETIKDAQGRAVYELRVFKLKGSP